MRAAEFDAYGSAENLKVRHVPLPPPPGPGEIQVRIAAVSVNPKDTFVRKGAGADRPPVCGYMCGSSYV